MTPAEPGRWDGQRYPDGLSGEEIPLAGRIIHACDAWHAMTSDRPYRATLGRAALDELQENMGEQVDPRVVLALVEVVESRRLLAPGQMERMIGGPCSAGPVHNRSPHL